MIVRELNGLDEMLKHLNVLNELYPHLTEEEYKADLQEMLPHNYGQVAVFEGEECLGISGFWIGKKLWCGKYLELDNIVVSAKHRSRGVGKLIFGFNTKALKVSEKFLNLLHENEIKRDSLMHTSSSLSSSSLSSSSLSDSLSDSSPST